MGMGAHGGWQSRLWKVLSLSSRINSSLINDKYTPTHTHTHTLNITKLLSFDGLTLVLIVSSCGVVVSRAMRVARWRNTHVKSGTFSTFEFVDVWANSVEHASLNERILSLWGGCSCFCKFAGWIGRSVSVSDLRSPRRIWIPPARRTLAGLTSWVNRHQVLVQGLNAPAAAIIHHCLSFDQAVTARCSRTFNWKNRSQCSLDSVRSCYFISHAACGAAMFPRAIQVGQIGRLGELHHHCAPERNWCLWMSPSRKQAVWICQEASRGWRSKCHFWNLLNVVMFDVQLVWNFPTKYVRTLEPWNYAGQELETPWDQQSTGSQHVSTGSTLAITLSIVSFRCAPLEVMSLAVGVAERTTSGAKRRLTSESVPVERGNPQQHFDSLW